MSGLVHSLLVLAGLRTPRRPPSARKRGKAEPPRPGARKQQAPTGRTREGSARPAQPRAGQAAAPKTGAQVRKPAGAPARAPGKAPAAGQRRGGKAFPGPLPRGDAPARVGSRGIDALDALDEVFADAGPAESPRPGVAARKQAGPRTHPPKARSGPRVSGLGMFLLAGSCLTMGGWLGSQVQAYAYGAAGTTIQDMSAMRSFDPAAGLRY